MLVKQNQLKVKFAFCDVGYLLFCVIQEQMLLTKDSLSQNMEAIRRKYEVCVLFWLLAASRCIDVAYYYRCCT